MTLACIDSSMKCAYVSHYDQPSVSGGAGLSYVSLLLAATAACSPFPFTTCCMLLVELHAIHVLLCVAP